MISGGNSGGIGPSSPGPDGDRNDPDRDDIDSAFAAIIAHFSDEATPDRYPPLPAVPGTPAEPADEDMPSEPSGEPTPAEASGEPAPAAPTTPIVPARDVRPLFRFSVAPGPEPESADQVEEDESFELEPLPPARRPSAPTLAGWLLLSFSIVCALIAMFGVSLPRWLGWAAVAGFAGGFGLLILQLPWQRSPGDGDGAVL